MVGEPALVRRCTNEFLQAHAAGLARARQIVEHRGLAFRGNLPVEELGDLHRPRRQAVDFVLVSQCDSFAFRTFLSSPRILASSLRSHWTRFLGWRKSFIMRNARVKSMIQTCQSLVMSSIGQVRVGIVNQLVKYPDGVHLLVPGILIRRLDLLL